MSYHEIVAYVAQARVQQARSIGPLLWPGVLTEEQLRQRSIRAKQKMCMARLRAEQRGQDTSGFPKRERNRKALQNNCCHPPQPC